MPTVIAAKTARVARVYGTQVAYVDSRFINKKVEVLWFKSLVDESLFYYEKHRNSDTVYEARIGGRNSVKITDIRRDTLQCKYVNK